MANRSTLGGQSLLSRNHVHRADLLADPQTPRRHRTAVPRDAEAEDGIRREEVRDKDGNVHVHVIMPAQLARDVELTIQMSPRRRNPPTETPPRSPINWNIRPDIGPLRLNCEHLASPPPRHRAPPSPPRSRPRSPSPPFRLRVPNVAPPPDVSSLFTPKHTLSDVSNPSTSIFWVLLTPSIHGVLMSGMY